MEVDDVGDTAEGRGLTHRRRNGSRRRCRGRRELRKKWNGRVKER